MPGEAPRGGETARRTARDGYRTPGTDTGRQRKLPWGQAIVQTALHVGLRFGNAKQVDPTLEKLLGRRPRTVRDYIRDHRTLWKPA